MDIRTALLNFGFTDKEISVYLKLAQLGRAPAHILAKQTKIIRSSIYPILNRLVEKGLVSTQQDNNVSLFICNSPNALLSIVREEKSRISERELLAMELVKLAAPYFQRKHYSIPSLQVFDGEKNVLNMLEEFLQEYFESMSKYDDTLWGYQDHSFVLSYRPWLEKYWREKSKSHKICLFSNRSDVESKLKDYVQNREIRTIAKDFQLSSTLWISGDYITLISTRQTPHYALQLRDEVFAENIRRVFQAFWHLSG